MKKLFLIIVALLFTNIFSGYSQELTKEMLKSELAKILKDSESGISQYKGSLLYGSQTYSSDLSFLGISIQYLENDNSAILKVPLLKDYSEKDTFIWKKFKDVVKTYAKENGGSAGSNDDDNYEIYNLYNKNGKNVMSFLKHKRNKDGEIIFYPTQSDPNKFAYLGTVTNFCYQSSNAATSDYAYFQVIHLYAKGNPNMSGDQLIEFARNNTIEQINRRNWRWRGKILDTNELNKEIKTHQSLGKRTIYEEVFIK